MRGKGNVRGRGKRGCEREGHEGEGCVREGHEGRGHVRGEEGEVK